LPTVLQKRKGDLLLPIHKSDAAKDEKYFLSDSEETRRLDSPSKKNIFQNILTNILTNIFFPILKRPCS